ncbi:hypothetical protein GCM10027612_64150 [Microbispora bryophytorum subsp. camponoti]
MTAATALAGTQPSATASPAVPVPAETPHSAGDAFRAGPAGRSARRDRRTAYTPAPTMAERAGNSSPDATTAVPRPAVSPAAVQVRTNPANSEADGPSRTLPRALP